MDNNYANNEVWCDHCKNRLQDSTEGCIAGRILQMHEFSNHIDHIFDEEDGVKVSKEECQHSTDDGFLKDVTQALFGPYKKELPQELRKWQIEVTSKAQRMISIPCR
jgi:hypothetical protein